MYSFNLQLLLSLWKVNNIPLIFITGITLDSRYVFPGDLFVAVNGHHDDGRHYIFDAIKMGVSAVIFELDKEEHHGFVRYIEKVPIIYLYNVKRYLSLLAGIFYKHPSSLLKLVGVTGTNGKTIVSNLLFQWVHFLCEETAIMGSIGNGIFNYLNLSLNTTPSAIEAQKMLAYFYQRNVTFVAMEVSSHALVQHRVRDLYFHAAVFTNLTHDHLDYHRDMKSYEQAKWRLFSELQVKEYIINSDDYTGFQWMLKLSRGTVITWDRRKILNFLSNKKWLHVISVQYRRFGFDVIFDSSWGKGLVSTNLIGRYNVNNVLLALATLLTLDYPLSSLLNTAHKLFSVPGRMEIFRSSGYPTVVVDYAHTPDALKYVLLEIRSYCLSQIWCVFGCGGDRDQKKRSIMGNIAEKYSDNIVITDDNPRTESSEDIINDIKSGFVGRQSKYFQVIPKRKEALYAAITQAKCDDWILIAGKGHESHQIIGSKKMAYSDQVVVKDLLGIEK